MSLDTNIQKNDERMTIWKSKEIIEKLAKGEIEKDNLLVKRALKHSKLYDNRLRKDIYGELSPTLLELEGYNLKNKKTLGI